MLILEILYFTLHFKTAVIHVLITIYNTILTLLPPHYDEDSVLYMNNNAEYLIYCSRLRFQACCTKRFYEMAFSSN